MTTTTTTTVPIAKDTSMATHHPQSTAAMSTAASSLPEATFPSIINPSPVTIAEILLHIGSFLNTRSLRNALCVSKDWYTTLYPLLWQRIYLWQDPDNFDPDVGPSFSNLRRHASSITSLEVHSHKFAASCSPDPNDGDNPLFFPNLAVLEIDTHYNRSIKDPAIFSFLERQQTTIKDLTLTTFHSIELARILDHELPLLTRLSIKNWDFHGLPNAFMDQYHTLWSRLVSLSLYEFTLFNTKYERWKNLAMATDLLERAPPTRLQELIMVAEDYATHLEQIRLQLLFILNSPDLVRLEWATRCEQCDPETYEDVEVVEDGPMAQVARAIKSGKFHQGQQQQLKSLGLGLGNFRIQDLEIILNSFQSSLKELSLNSTNFGEDCWTLIKDHYPRYMSTITSLDLNDCPLLKGSQVQDILCSITSLKVFKADYIKCSNLERDHERGRFWVCLGLKELSVGFACRTRRGQYLFLDQLSRLLRLEVLDLDKPTDDSEMEKDEEVSGVEGTTVDEESELRNPVVDTDSTCQRSLLLTLAEGMDCLKSLRSLRHLEGSYIHPWGDSGKNCRHCVWTEAEARWVTQNWVGLEKLSNIPMAKEVQLVLEERIKLSFCDLTD
ncbi:hypothetical protein BGZ83_000395 [Gryganskiella cystojenkinii]|nr:hypothetical protein BGZ83_000395 [Gryganskiella cystojenkinii]